MNEFLKRQQVLLGVLEMFCILTGMARYTSSDATKLHRTKHTHTHTHTHTKILSFAETGLKSTQDHYYFLGLDVTLQGSQNKKFM